MSPEPKNKTAELQIHSACKTARVHKAVISPI